MKNIKTLTLGILIGAIATVSITALAEYLTVPNPFPIKVNGTETAIEGYNINDNTYFKLRDVADAVGGFEVGFSDNTITIDTGNVVKPEPTVAPTPIPSSEIPPQATELNPVFSTNVPHENGLTSDGIPIKVSDNGEKYVSTISIDKVYHYEDYGYSFGTSSLYDNNSKEIVLKDIPTASPKNSNPTYEYYETVLRPFFIEHCR